MAGADGLTAADRLLAAVRVGLPARGRFVVALSGGADSAAVAWALVRSVGPERVCAVHVHHGQDASDALAAAARAIAGGLGISLHRVDVKVPAGASFEGQARRVRLQALEDSVGEDEFLVTGHHAGDAVETVLANLLRGAGATGLAGILRRRQRWFRPAIDVSADVVRATAVELGLSFIDDPANIDPRHTRNVIRAEVIPWLEERLGVPVARVVRRSASSLAFDDATLDRFAASVSLGESAGAVVVAASVLSTLSPAVAARVARRALRRAHPPYPGNRDDVVAILEVASGSVARVVLTGGFTVEREGPLVAIYSDLPRVPDPVELDTGVAVRFGPWTVAMCSGVSRPAVGRSRVAAAGDALNSGAVIRAASRGERIDFGRGSKPVRGAMGEAGVPVRLRSAWPVVAVGAKIAWVAGVRLAGWAHPSRSKDGELVELSVEGIGV